MNDRNDGLIETPASELSEALKEKMKNVVSTYSVALTCNGLACGSGTLIQCNGVFGILTASHVVKESPIKMGDASREIGIPFLNAPSNFNISCEFLEEIEIGVPEKYQYTVAGPDVTFIKFPKNAPYIDTLNSKKAFWNVNAQLEKMPTADRRKFCHQTGYPEELITTSEKNERVFRVHQPIMMGGTLQESEYRVEGVFDYVDCDIEYKKIPGLPENFEGTSGGGVWLFKLMKYPNGDMDVVEPELSGVVFWQTFMNSEIVKLSAHFHKAISCLPEMIQAYDA